MRIEPTVKEIEASAAKSTILSLDKKSAKEFYATLHGKFSKAYKEITEGATYNFDKCSEFKGTPDEIQNNLRLLNADRIAVRNRISNITKVEMQEAELERDQHFVDVATRGTSNRESANIAVADTNQVSRPGIIQLFADDLEIGESTNENGKPVSLISQMLQRQTPLSGGLIGLRMSLGLDQIFNVLTEAGTDGGVSVFPQQSTLITDKPFPPNAIELFPRLPVTSSTFEYRRKTSARQLAYGSGTPAEKAAGIGATAEAEKAKEIQPKWEKTIAQIEAIRAFARVSEEQLEDAPTDMLLQRELLRELRNAIGRELLLGTGANNRIQGIFGVTGVDSLAQGPGTATVPTFGRDMIDDATAAIFNEVWMEPDAILMTAADWVSHLKARDDDNRPLVLDSDRNNPSINGIPVMRTPHVTEDGSNGTVMVGVFGEYAMLLDHKDVIIQSVNSNEDDFVKGTVTVRGGVRLGVARLQNDAFKRITGWGGRKQP